MAKAASPIFLSRAFDVLHSQASGFPSSLIFCALDTLDLFPFPRQTRCVTGFLFLIVSLVYLVCFPSEWPLLLDDPALLSLLCEAVPPDLSPTMSPATLHGHLRLICWPASRSDLPEGWTESLYSQSLVDGRHHNGVGLLEGWREGWLERWKGGKGGREGGRKGGKKWKKEWMNSI